MSKTQEPKHTPEDERRITEFLKQIAKIKKRIRNKKANGKQA